MKPAISPRMIQLITPMRKPPYLSPLRFLHTLRHSNQIWMVSDAFGRLSGDRSPRHPLATRMITSLWLLSAECPARRDSLRAGCNFEPSFLVCALMMIVAARATRTEFPIALAIALARLP
jgi:hypothetical protein